MICDDTNFMEK